jgi:hypothetical protein
VQRCGNPNHWGSEILRTAVVSVPQAISNQQSAISSQQVLVVVLTACAARVSGSRASVVVCVFMSAACRCHPRVG